MRRLFAALTFCLALLCPVALPVASQPATQSQQDPKAVTVYVTRTGKKYHRDGCRYLTASKIEISPKDAKAKGYTACKVCRPPD
jgi:biopolymer transport protein ExbD